MMNEKDLSGKIRNAFEDVKPSPEFISHLSEEKIRVRKRKKPVLKVFLVAAAIFLIGSAGVYAASEISFKDVFGDYIHVSDNEFADSMLGSVREFKYSISDNDYAVRVIGVAGDRNNMMLKAEIYRADGTPVKDHFKNLPGPDTEDYRYLDLPSEYGFSFVSDESKSYGSYLNEDGNVEISCMIESSGKLAGKVFNASGTDVYSSLLENEFEEKNDADILYDSDLKKSVIHKRSDQSASLLSDEDIIGIRLDWSFEFKYVPSKMAAPKKKMVKSGESFTTNNSIMYLADERKDDSPADQSVECRPVKMEFTSVGGMIKYTLVDNEDIIFLGSVKSIETDHTVSYFPSYNNDMYIISEDGSRTDFVFSGARAYGLNSKNKARVKANFEYIEYNDTDENGVRTFERIFADASKFKELHINGTVYQLK